MLHVHRAERADGLVRALGDLLAEPLADPMATEIVSVPTRGIERWLAQTLSERLGVCANVDFPPPGRVVADAVAAACGIDPDTDPWRPERSAWTLLDVVEEQLEADWLAPLRRYLGAPDDDVRRARRFGIVRHLAGLFDSYALHRPDMVRGWAAGEEDHWQAELWRQLRARIGSAGPAERLVEATEVIRSQTGARLSVFGLTRLPTGHLRVLDALAVGRDVHLFLLHPSPALWERLSNANPVELRAEDQSALVPDNALLASWGRDIRELQLVLSGTADAVDHHHEVDPPKDTQLGALQAAIRADVPPPPTTKDGSLEVHSCHGRARQVEVLRDAILRTLAADETLEPRDVIVMCPDIETFAPLIQATFGSAEPDLRVRLADRSLRQTNPVLGVVAALLDLAAARVTASEVLDLADREPVRRRFGFADDDLARLQEWIAASGTRWGLDAEHREPWRVNTTDAGTWRFGVDRVLAGVTMTEDDRHLMHGILPLDDVDSVSISLAGAFAELLARIESTVEAFGVAKSAPEWAQALGAAADAFTRTPAREAWQRAELDGVLIDLAEHGGATAEPLTLAEVRRLLADRFEGRPTRANFRTGHLTACTLHPMRSVPHRVVCLLGLDDGVFPRKARRDGEDLTLLAPHIGERDPRAEDRQLLLDALLAAEDKLIVTYAGRDERTNAVKPPAVPVGELLDVLEKGHVIEHALQPFDPRNFDAAAPLSFDAATLAGARALRRPRHVPPAFLPGELPPLDEPLIDLADLVRFAEHPVRGFLQRRLGVELRDFEDEVEDGLAIELDGLKRYGVGQRLLEARLAGVDARAAREAELRGGQLPPGALGTPIVDDALPVVERLVEAAGSGEAGTVDVRIELPDGRTLRGTVPGVYDRTLRTASYATLAARHRIGAWVRLLALCAHDPASGYHARTIGRRGSGVAVAELPTVEAALGQLAGLVDLYDRGLRAPLPLAPKTSAAYVEAGAPAARKQWETQYVNNERWEREAVEPEYVQVYGRVLSYTEFAAKPGYDEVAHVLWDPIREHES